MRLSARSWDRVPRMTTPWWSSRSLARILVYISLKYLRFFSSGAFVGVPLARARGSGGPPPY